MKTNSKKISFNNKFGIGKYFLILLLAIVTFSCKDDDEPEIIQETPNSSQFINGVDKWTIEGDGQGGEGIIPNFSPIEGLNNSGYIYANDNVTGGVWYFVAPNKYHGNKSEFMNGKIEFWLIQDSAMTNLFDDSDIIIEGENNKKIIHFHTAAPTDIWTAYSINLDSTGVWMYEGQEATNEQIQNILSNISKISIRGEFESGEDTGGLDGFSFIKL